MRRSTVNESVRFAGLCSNTCDPLQNWGLGTNVPIRPVRLAATFGQLEARFGERLRTALAYCVLRVFGWFERSPADRTPRRD
jgi:hypothetical protein